MAWDVDVGELEGTVVDAVEADLVAAVADLDPRERHIGGEVAKGDDEGVNPMVDMREKEPRKDGSEFSVECCVAYPPLDGAVVGRVDNELVGGGVKGSCCLQSLDV